MTTPDRPEAVHWRDAKSNDPIDLDSDHYPELFDGLLGKRIMAFVIDWLLLAVVTVFTTIIMAILGALTLGLLWPLTSIIVPALWLAYFTFSIGSPVSATPGMRFAGIEVRTWDGARPGYLQAALQTLVFYVTWVVTIFVALVPLFNRRRRCLHDYLIGTVVINSPQRIPTPQTIIST
ncbi:RDD family protein [Pyruvatibacter sp.]|uniref:RDD family protein n=1 Tax=Pyruvatibacter sp. TaxID=1981328 RepID=UPI0032EDC3BB